MTFQFRKSSCVAVGTFNIYIVQPSLLVEVGTLGNTEENSVELETDFSQPGFRYTFIEAELKFTVRPDRFIVESENREVDCGSVMGKVLQALEWTPLTALGINFNFATTEEVELSRIKALYFPKFEKHDDRILQRTVHAAAQVGAAKFNLQIALKNDSADFMVNSHFDLSDKGDRKQKSHLAQSATKSFFEMRKAGIALTEQLFEVRLENADNDGR